MMVLAILTSKLIPSYVNFQLLILIFFFLVLGMLFRNISVFHEKQGLMSNKIWNDNEIESVSI